MVAIATVGSVSLQIAVNTAVTLAELLDFGRPRHHAIVVTTERWGPVATGGFAARLA
jgi:hypothetical protein